MKKLNLVAFAASVALLAPACVGASLAGAMPLGQYATSATATDSYYNYEATYAVGAPNATSCADIGSQAWTYAGNASGSALTLGYANTVLVSSLNIYFSYDFSNDLRVEVGNGTTFTTVGEITAAQSCSGSPDIVVNIPVSTDVVGNQVRLTALNTSGYPEIDAVQLIGYAPQAAGAPTSPKVTYTAGKSHFTWTPPSIVGAGAIKRYQYCLGTCQRAANWKNVPLSGGNAVASLTLPIARGVRGTLYVRAVTVTGYGAVASVRYAQAR